MYSNLTGLRSASSIISVPLHYMRSQKKKRLSNQIKQVMQEIWMLFLGHVGVYKDIKVQRYTFMNSNEFWALSHFNLTVLCFAEWRDFLCPWVTDFNATDQYGVFYDTVYQCECQALLNWICCWGKEERRRVFMCMYEIHNLSSLYKSLNRARWAIHPSIHQRQMDRNRSMERDRTVLTLYCTNW